MHWNHREACPDDQLLKLSIQENDDTSPELVAHIETCETCQQRLDILTSDQIVAETRDQWQLPTNVEKMLPPPRPEALSAIGQFAVESVIGSGGMGIVYRGWDTQLRRAVAIKVVRPDQSELASQRFSRECQALAQLHHDHIVPVFSTGSLPNGMSYLVMPLMTGGSLGERLADQHLSIRQAAEIAHAVARGLSAAHAAGLIHRDVKPANILFDGPDGRPRLTDFGLVRTTHDPGLTQGDLICGTPEYMSPEQAHQPDRIDARSDIYSLGITLYQCLTGVPPYRGRPLDILNQHRLGDPMPPSRLNRQIPRDLESICLKAISTSPEDRYATANAFSDDLKRFLESRPVHAKPVSHWKRARLWCERNRSLAFSLAAIFLVLLSGVIVSSTFWIRSEANAQVARELNTRLISSNEELLANRQRLRMSVSKFQEKVFSDESLHWQMSRDFRAAMFRDVIEFLDEFATHDPVLLHSDQHDALAGDYLDVARAAAHVRQNEEARVAAGRVIARLQPLVDTKENGNHVNWSMLNESTRILMGIKWLKKESDQPSNSAAVQNDDRSLEDLRQISVLSADRALQLAPDDFRARLNDLATRFACLKEPPETNDKEPESKLSLSELDSELDGELTGKFEDVLKKVIQVADELIKLDDRTFLPSAVTLAAEIGWEIMGDNPETAKTWLPSIEQQIVRCREILRTHDFSITAMDMLRGGNFYHHGLALANRDRPEDAAKLFGQAIPIFNRAVVLQPQNRLAVLQYGHAAEAATRCYMRVEDYQQAQKTLDASLIVVSKSLQTDPKDNELRMSVIEWFCLYGDISRHIEDYEWATRGYATAAGDSKLFFNPSPELVRWSYDKRKYALQELLEIIDKSSMAARKPMYQQMLQQLESDHPQFSKPSGTSQ